MFSRAGTKLLLLGFSLSITVGSLEFFLARLKLNHLGVLRENPRGTGSYRQIPNFKSVQVIQGQSVAIETNRHGMRWREISEDKPPGKTRIAFLGDSFTWGAWSASVETAFVGQVDRVVGGEKHEVLNFGIGGYGIDDEELLLKEEVIRFSPDIVVLSLFTGNDFRDTFLGLNKFRIVDGTTEWRSPPPNGAGKPLSVFAGLSDSLVTSVKASHLYGLLRPITLAFRSEKRDLTFRPSEDFLSFTYWSRQPLPNEGKAAIAATLEHLERIRQYCAEKGIRMVLVSLPFEEQVISPSWDGPGYSLDYPEKYVQDFARSRNVPYYSLLRPLREEFKRDPATPLYLPFDVHFNDRGHRFVGERIAAFLKSEVLSPPGR